MRWEERSPSEEEDKEGKMCNAQGRGLLLVEHGALGTVPAGGQGAVQGWEGSLGNAFKFCTMAKTSSLNEERIVSGSLGRDAVILSRRVQGMDRI